MNSTQHSHATLTLVTSRAPGGSQARKDRLTFSRSALLLALTFATTLAGCSFLKPTKSTARYYVLTPMPSSSPATANTAAISVGVGSVKLPSYLFNSSIALRKGTNEVEYLQSDLWAERLDTGFQRVLAADLASVLGTDRVLLSAWRPEEVNVEVYVAIEQFDVDATGAGVLVARWRLLSPGGDKVLKFGATRLSRQGPHTAAAMVDTLSELLADFSGELGRAIQEASPARTNADRESAAPEPRNSGSMKPPT